MAAWNTSGMRLVLVPAPRDRALIRIRGLRRGTHGLGCVGVVGATSSPGDGRGGLSSAEVRIATGCGQRALFQQVTAHELGHALGLGHENRRCSTMVASNVIGARRCGSAWLARCRVLQPDDIRGVVHLLPRPRRADRPRRPRRLHRPGAGLGRDAERASRPARDDRDGVAGRARQRAAAPIVVGRRRGACPSSPLDARGTFFYARRRRPAGAGLRSPAGRPARGATGSGGCRRAGAGRGRGR